MSDPLVENRRHPVRAFLISPLFAATAFWVAHWVMLDMPAVRPGGNLVGEAAGVAMLLLATTILMWLVMAVFALPVYGLLRWFKFENAILTIALAGAIAGFIYALPDLIWAGESPSVSVYVGGCQSVDKGVRTVCGWQRFWLGVGFYCLVGFVGGAAFWRLYAGKWVWRL